MSPMRPGWRALILAAAAFAVAFAVVAMPSLARAQAPPAEPPIAVQVLFAEAAATVGDRVHLAVLVTHPNDIVVTVQRPILADFSHIGSSGPESQALGDGFDQTSVTFTLQVFALGETAPTPVVVSWVTEDGVTGNVLAEAPLFTVVPTRAPGDLALRPAAPPLSIDGAPPAWLRPVAAVAGVVVLLAALAVGVSRWRSRRPQMGMSVEGEAAPEGLARDRLAAVQGLELVSDADFQRYYGTIAEVVRGYLGERFAFNAAALTTSELEQRMRAHGVDRWQARLVSGLLDRCDRAVYARQYPDPASADHDLTVAYEIVELSRPRADVDELVEEAAAS